MCGIAGIWNFKGEPADRGTLAAMGRAMQHRGPDEESLYTDRGLGLVHRRLSIIDLTSGMYPVFNEDRSVCTILNGEIYNFKHLRRTLEKQGHRFSTRTDTEVLVHLYEQYGDDFLDHLNGMFALALWDATRKKLLLARDRMGQKPLYYYYDGTRFAFASEVQVLKKVPAIRFSCDPVSTALFFRYQYVPAPRSIYQQVHKLEAGSMLSIENGRMDIRKYWELPSETPDEARTLEDWSDEFRELLSTCVRDRMVADVPLGGFLSGGADSTAIVDAMCHAGSERIKTFTIGFKSASYDERSAAASVAAQLGTDHSIHVMDEFPVHEIPKLLSHFGEPYADGSAIPTYYLCQMARQHVTVALSGDGADELLGGYNRYLAGALAQTYFRLPGLLRPARLTPLTAWLPEHKGYYGKSSIKKVKHLARFMDNLRAGEGCPSPRIFQDQELTRLLPHFPDLSEDPVSARDREFLNQTLPSRMLWSDCRSYLPDDIFVKTDRMSMAHALEVRAPFVDYRLVEFLSRVPMRFKTYKGNTKILLKHLLSENFPAISARPKHGFEAPIAHWLTDELHTPFSDLLHSNKSGIFNRAFVEKMLRDHVDTKTDLSKQLWPIYCFLNWEQQHRH